MNISVYFIPPYAPDFAPVEMCFSQIKRNLSEQCKRETVKLTLKENYSKVYDSLLSVKTRMVKNMYGELYQTIRAYL